MMVENRLLKILFRSIQALLFSGAFFSSYSLTGETALKDAAISGDSPTIEEPGRAALLEGYFARIRDLEFDYGKVGSVLEALAFLELQQIFPETDYEILAGLQYQDFSDRTAGELDLVVWEKESRRAVRIYEVKLSINLGRARKLALAQLERFKAHIKEKNISQFIYNRDRYRAFRVSQFEEIVAYGVIANQGAREEGFDIEIDLTREEADGLQELLIRYKMNRGH